ncbi:MAG TPA: site-specific DNA-methyltransferase [Chloroflexota bacterium]|nr:site-specific DNA-methyltransferase [Chloroflexota bacterium]
MIRDIKPASPVRRLRRNFSEEEVERRFSISAVAPVVGMSRAYIVRALGYRPGSRPATISLTQVLELLDVDGYQETFVPRSLVPDYLLGLGTTTAQPPLDTRETATLLAGDARALLPALPAGSVQCVVTSSPYWGMRVYETHRDIAWADGERCPYGFEQTPEGFIRHTVELLHLLRPAMSLTGSVWWNLMDTYNTRTPIRGSSHEKLRAMGGQSDYTLGWTEHLACRHSAGHMYLEDGEQSSIPGRVAERASRIGYWLKSLITWNKNSTPEPVRSRVTRHAEYILHLSVRRAPVFKRAEWQRLPRRLGGPNPPFESVKKLTDIWWLPTGTGQNGHGAEFPIALPARCISLSTKKGDLVLDPFVGGGTTAIAAAELGRRFVGFDISRTYVARAKERLELV